ncbi:hypothetical protein F2Q69_00013240 [Brassica cretica]|uniref:Uncharacterized protein n=1 Tax=Brassica cretica TaxID=69181 RepID=A0A8S9QQW3_BRACR|nr:hypothetical protein F2Q69_00013240 [Brassica cretica]
MCRLHNSIYTWITTIPRRHVHRGDLIVTVRPWWYVHDDVYGELFLAVSRLTLTATYSGGSEHYLHRSFAQPSRSKKSDQNQKYVNDSSPETVRL